MKLNKGKTLKRGHLMPYISDKALYAAVMYARRLIRAGNPPAMSIVQAARYWHVDKSDVAHYVGIVASNVKNRRRRMKARP